MLGKAMVSQIKTDILIISKRRANGKRKLFKRNA
nr:MAG TPA: hypothetical protein [Caudoviricetes sp.]